MRGQCAVAVGTGDGVGGDAARQVLRQMLGEGGEGGLFGAADVADDGVGTQQGGGGAADGGEGGNGGGDEHQFGFADVGGGNVAGGAVDYPPLQGAFEVGGIGVDARNVAHQAEPFQIEGERAADQADTDQGELADGFDDGHGAASVGWFEAV